MAQALLPGGPLFCELILILNSLPHVQNEPLRDIVRFGWTGLRGAWCRLTLTEWEGWEGRERETERDRRETEKVETGPRQENERQKRQNKAGTDRTERDRDRWRQEGE